MGARGGFASGFEAHDSIIAITPMADLRTPAGQPIPIVQAENATYESGNLRNLTVYCEGGKLYIYYECKVGNNSIINVAVVSLEDASQADAPSPTISVYQQVSSVTATVGAITGKLNFVALTSDGSAISYQWYKNTANSAAGGTAISSAVSSSYALPASLTAGTYYYYCQATSATAGSVTSGVAVVTITNAATTPTISATRQPEAVSVTVGEVSGSLTFTAAASDGSAVTYQWYKGTSGVASGGTAISGATGSGYALPSDLTAGTHYYYCKATSATAGSVTSGVAVVTATAAVIVPVITITQQPQDAAITQGGSARLTCAAACSDGAAVTYTWKYAQSGAAVGSGAYFDVPTTRPLGATQYICTVSAAGAASVDSRTVTVTEAPPEDVYLAQYDLTGTAGAAIPATLADASGHGNALTVSGGMVYDGDGHIPITATGRALSSGAINLNGATSFTIHMTGVYGPYEGESTQSYPTSGQNRILVLPGIDLNFMFSNMGYVKLETTVAGNGVSTDSSSPTIATYADGGDLKDLTGLRRFTFDLQMAGDTAHMSVTMEGDYDATLGRRKKSVALLDKRILNIATALTSGGLYVGNRADLARPIGCAITEFWIKEG